MLSPRANWILFPCHKWELLMYTSRLEKDGSFPSKDWNASFCTHEVRRGETTGPGNIREQMVGAHRVPAGHHWLSRFAVFVSDPSLMGNNTMTYIWQERNTWEVETPESNTQNIKPQNSKGHNKSASITHLAPKVIYVSRTPSTVEAPIRVLFP